MGILQGLKQIQKHQAETEARRQAAADGGTKATWFGLKDGQSAKVRPLQELDADAKNYSTKNGLGFLAVEHSNPKLFKNKALCSLSDEGRCVGCEKHEMLRGSDGYTGGWKQKTRLYLNVLVDNGVDEPYVAILSQGDSAKSVTPTLVEYATETNSITNRWFKIKRTGSGMSDTSYTIMALDTDDSVNPEDYELYDLNNYVRTVPYEEQEAHFNWTPDQQRQEPRAEVSAASVNREW